MGPTRLLVWVHRARARIGAVALGVDRLLVVVGRQRHMTRLAVAAQQMASLHFAGLRRTTAGTVGSF